jgi:4-hydroxy-2-oxoheptanedioate aldolase
VKLNRVKQQLARGEPSRGIWLGVPSSHSARLLARLPVDWLLIDAEHAPIDVNTLTHMVAAIAEADGPAPLVRVPQASVENLKQALDAGAYGVPMINSPEEAEQVVAWSKFPPHGQRSFGSAYAGLSLDLSMAEYLRSANAQTLCMIQIESKAALDRLDAIFEVAGVDMAFVGPVDLSISLGLEPIPENRHPRFQEAIDLILRTAHAHHLPVGIYCSNGKAAADRIAQGFQFVNVASDVSSLIRGVETEIEAAR